MKNTQKFWGIVNKTTGKLSRNMSTYNLFHTRTAARMNLKAQMKSKSSTYKIIPMEVYTADVMW